MLLGCLTTDLTCAIEMAAVLARSAVPVIVHTQLPEQPYAAEGAAPFHILVLSSASGPAEQSPCDDLPRAVAWLQQANATRIALIQPRHTLGASPSPMARLADDLLLLLARPGNNRLYHCKHAGSPSTMTLDLRLPVVRLPDDVLTEGAAETANALQGLSITEPSHVIVKAATDYDYLTAIRGTERAHLITGTADLALHLPALFRVRGWLMAERHTQALRSSTGLPTLQCGPSASRKDGTLDSWLTQSLADSPSSQVLLCSDSSQPDTRSIAILERLGTNLSPLSVSHASLPANDPLVQTLMLGADHITSD